MLGEPYVTVDPDAETPPYQQIFDQLRVAVERRVLSPGDALPTVRRLAADLGVAPNTVARAYADLQAEGLIVSDGRRGSRVREGSRTIATRARGDALREAAERFIQSLSQRGYTRTEIGAAVRRMLTES